MRKQRTENPRVATRKGAVVLVESGNYTTLRVAKWRYAGQLRDLQIVLV